MQGTNYYRLLITDKDGSSTYSEIRSINFSNNNIAARIYPNPVKDKLAIEFNSAIAVKAGITITSTDGKMVKQLTTQLQSGNNKITMPVAGLVSGTYLLRINTNEQQQLMKFIKQ
ncbi:MAG TPA: T9SS type A sorting domain-containing protein [Panacibacter sp.]|nr:T9SS type A sorting domain-containing protein [Panacibacter sp.]